MIADKAKIWGVEPGLRYSPKMLKYALLALGVILLLFFNPFGTIGAGERGILLRFSAVTGRVYGEGLYFIWPIMERVVKVDIKLQKEQVPATAASKDLQTVSSDVALNFHINPEKVALIYQEVGLDFKARIIDPTLQESVKAITAKFTAEELITKREIVKEEIRNLLRDTLASNGIIVDEFNIVSFNFSESFNDAIEAKVTAEQQALAVKNKLEQIKFEAEQKIAEARGKAEAIKVESEALRSNPAILELRALEKWNGILPQVTSGGIPFINIQPSK
ncbi:MAG: prohibitin family protein [Acidobacteria bacterium]|nr:prohibitin family protein [Acidobacteriota bacterium]